MTTYFYYMGQFSIFDIWIISNFKRFNKYFKNKCIHIPDYFLNMYYKR